MRIVNPIKNSPVPGFMVRCNCGVQFFHRVEREMVECKMCHRKEAFKPMLNNYLRRNQEEEIKL